jgi:hypothetical protein
MARSSGRRPPFSLIASVVISARRIAHGHPLFDLIFAGRWMGRIGKRNGGLLYGQPRNGVQRDVERVVADFAG